MFPKMQVFHPQSTGISGGGFLLLYNPNTADLKAYDFRETAPSGLVEAMRRATDGGAKKLTAAQSAAFNVGVPGTLRGLAAVHSSYGKLAWADLFAQNIAWLRNGFPATKMLAYRARLYPDSGRYMNDMLRRYILDENNQTLPEGQIIRRPQLADVYERIAQFGAEDFYTGQLAQQFVDEIQRAGGVITLDDMRNYEIRMREPIVTKLENGIEFYTMPAPSSGAALVLAMKLLQKFERAASTSSALKNVDEPTRSHFLIEAMKMTFLLRTRLGDPDIAANNVSKAQQNMMSDANVERLYNAINLAHSMKPVDYYRAVNIPFNVSGKPDHGTSGSVFIDNDGLMVSIIHSVNNVFGSGIMSEKLGLIFNDELDDFGTASTIGGKQSR